MQVYIFQTDREWQMQRARQPSAGCLATVACCRCSLSGWEIVHNKDKKRQDSTFSWHKKLYS